MCTVTVHQNLVESLLEKGWSNTTSFLGLSACQLQAVEQVCFVVCCCGMKGCLQGLTSADEILHSWDRGVLCHLGWWKFTVARGKLLYQVARKTWSAHMGRYEAHPGARASTLNTFLELLEGVDSISILAKQLTQPLFFYTSWALLFGHMGLWESHSP